MVPLASVWPPIQAAAAAVFAVLPVYGVVTAGVFAWLWPR
jgi:hypothetical protein